MPEEYIMVDHAVDRSLWVSDVVLVGTVDVAVLVE